MKTDAVCTDLSWRPSWLRRGGGHSRKRALTWKVQRQEGTPPLPPFDFAAVSSISLQDTTQLHRPAPQSRRPRIHCACWVHRTRTAPSRRRETLAPPQTPPPLLIPAHHRVEGLLRQLHLANSFHALLARLLLFQQLLLPGDVPAANGLPTLPNRSRPHASMHASHTTHTS